MKGHSGVIALQISWAGTGVGIPSAGKGLYLHYGEWCFSH